MNFSEYGEYMTRGLCDVWFRTCMLPRISYSTL